MDITEGDTGNTPPFVNTKGGRRPPCWKSNTIITHAAVNGPTTRFQVKTPTFSAEDVNHIDMEL